MALSFEYVYLHGFRGDVQTTKGSLLKKGLAGKGIDLHIFDAKGGKGHEDTRVSVGLKALDDYYHEKKKPLRLVGSSMGGFMSAVYASQHPSHVDRVILLNPAVNLQVPPLTRNPNEHINWHPQGTWTTIADTEDATSIEKWRENGEMAFTAGKETKTVKIPYAYVEDSLEYPRYPDIPCPSLLLVGSQDRIIPPKNGYVLQLEQSKPEQMKLIEIDDDHDFLLPATVERIIDEALAFFE